MANSPQAIKRARQNDDRRAHNASRRSALRTAIKKVTKALERVEQHCHFVKVLGSYPNSE